MNESNNEVSLDGCSANRTAMEGLKPLDLFDEADQSRFHGLNAECQRMVLEELGSDQAQGSQPGRVSLMALLTRRYGKCSYGCASHGCNGNCETVFPAWFWDAERTECEASHVS